MDDQTNKFRMKSPLHDALSQNQSLPVVVAEMKVIGGSKTRESFLRAQIKEIVGKEYTVSSLLAALDNSSEKLQAFGIYSAVNYKLDLSPSAVNQSGSVPLIGTLTLRESARFQFKAGTSIGNGQADATVEGRLGNLFGGAEELTVSADRDIGNKRSYSVNYRSPIKNSDVWKSELAGFISSNERPWVSHDETLRGIRLKAVGPGVLGGTQELGYEAAWRTIGNLKPTASKTVRMEAGENFKSSIFNQWQLYKLNDIFLPTAGYSMKFFHEIAGFVPNNNGDIQFMKGQFEGKAVKSFFNNIFTFSLSGTGGLLWGLDDTHKTNLLDRFFLGGPNSVRGFYLNRLGPSDEEDSIGGEAYIAGGLSLFTRLPRVSADSPLRLHFFSNAGSLLGINYTNPSETFWNLLKTPSISTGFGLTYRHPAARFELNFTLPIATRTSEFPRKGFQFGLGMTFL
ncbi:surface antigen-domain-containing protein [Lipomyces oligophaga]|uniref:surface antigen-domain-containing protein n=1 Tax=Lipomyces oligophaga TaxID=45792 RepID=UPI0034CF19D3